MNGNISFLRRRHLHYLVLYVAITSCANYGVLYALKITYNSRYLPCLLLGVSVGTGDFFALRIFLCPLCVDMVGAVFSPMFPRVHPPVLDLQVVALALPPLDRAAFE